MRILIDGRLYGSENAGLGRYINNLISNLADIDRENEYIVLLRKKYFDFLKLPANWKKVLADFPHYGFREQIVLPGLIAGPNPDIVHFPHFNIPVLYMGKFVVTIHDTLMHEQKGLEATTLSAPIYFIKRLAYNFVFKKAVLKSQTIIVPSNAVKDDLIKRYRISDSKVIVTYEGVDEKIIQKGMPNIKRPYFVYVGNAYPHKNLARLIESIKLLNKKYKRNIFLVIASARNVFTQRLGVLISRMKAAEYVKSLGFIKDENLGSLLKNSVAFVFPSLSEGFGLPGLEAMSAGTLVLASDIPVFREIYGNNAFYFNPKDCESMVELMKKAVDLSESERSRRIKLGQVFVKRYSWSKMAQETLKVYQNEGSNSLRQGK